MSDLFVRLKRIRWRLLVRRQESVLFNFFTDDGHALFADETGIDWHPKLTLRLGTGEILHREGQLEELDRLLVQRGIKGLKALSKRIEHRMRELEQTTQKAATALATHETLKSYCLERLRCHNYLVIMPRADRVLSSLISTYLPAADDKELQSQLFILSYPVKENAHIAEQRSFFTLITQHETDGFDEACKKHAQRFGWMGTRGYFSGAWTATEVKERVEEFLKTGKDPAEELTKLNTARQEIDAKRKSLIQKLKLKGISDLIVLAQEYSYLRTLRTDILYKTFYESKPLFFAAAQTAGFPEEEITFLTYKEVLLMVKEKQWPITKEELSRRKEYVTSLWERGQHTILSGKEWAARFSGFIYQERENDEVRGIGTYPGKIRGRVRIVLRTAELSSVKAGDILVATMTFPHFIPAMEKASAFITDEGGILCHAAIIAREMRKPCVVGTGNATSVFKDGDLVEVDAEEGIVRKVS